MDNIKYDWAFIPEFDGFYKATEDGFILRCSRVSERSNGRALPLSDKVIKGTSDKDGYLKTTLINCGVKKSYRIHRLIAKTFIPNPEKKEYINHINGNKKDNRVTNLEWCSALENNVHAIEKLGRKSGRHWLGVFGKEHIRSIAICQFNKDNKLITEFGSIAEAIKNTNYLQPNISACLLGRTNSAYGYIWKYKKMHND